MVHRPEPAIARPEYDAIVLAGGNSRRLEGTDKAVLEVGGRRLLDRVLSAVVEARRCIVVGPPRDLPAPTVTTTERPPGGGPVAGLAAGLDHVQAPLVAVLACDLPFLTPDTLTALRAALDGPAGESADGSWLIDESGRPQPMVSVFRTRFLRLAVSSLDQVSNTSMRAMLGRGTMVEVRGLESHTWDCDTWAAVDRARRRAAEHQLEES